jgi:hypothetical protein
MCENMQLYPRQDFLTGDQLLFEYKPEVRSTPIEHCFRWWHVPLIPALGKQKQAELCEFKASLVYRMRSRTAKEHREILTQRKEKTKQNKTKQKSNNKNPKLGLGERGVKACRDIVRNCGSAEDLVS